MRGTRGARLGTVLSLHVTQTDGTVLESDGGFILQCINFKTVAHSGGGHARRRGHFPLTGVAGGMVKVLLRRAVVVTLFPTVREAGI